MNIERPGACAVHRARPPLTSLDAAKIADDIQAWFSVSFKMSKTLEEATPGAAACAGKLREQTAVFRAYLPVIVSLATPALKDRHWDRLSDLLCEPVEPNDDLTLRRLLRIGVLEKIMGVEEICVAAEKEYGLEKSLAAMKGEWTPIEFEIKDYRDTGSYV